MEKRGVSSFILHVLAMTFMLCDHVWATLLPLDWLTCIGRIAFPIFAFMIVEGYFYTRNIKKYLFRMLVFALISEIPFNLVMGSSWIYPFHQNVLWTFLLALLAICCIEKAKKFRKWWITWPVSVLVIVGSYYVGWIGMVDYYGGGILMVLVFYFFRGKKWWCYVGQAVCLAYINIVDLRSLYYTIQVGGYEIEIVQQGFALLALIPIWLYQGRQGYHSKWFQYFCYAFYPAHLLILYFVWQIMS